MKKQIVIGILTITMIGSFTGCQKKTEQNKVSTGSTIVSETAESSQEKEVSDNTTVLKNTEETVELTYADLIKVKDRYFYYTGKMQSKKPKEEAGSLKDAVAEGTVPLKNRQTNSSESAEQKLYKAEQGEGYFVEIQKNGTTQYKEYLPGAYLKEDAETKEETFAQDVSVIKVNGTYYHYESDYPKEYYITLKEPSKEVGTIEKVTTEGSIPKEDGETNEECLVGKKVYEIDGEQGVFLEYTGTKTTLHVPGYKRYFRLLEGTETKDRDQLTLSTMPSFVSCNGITYDYLHGESKKNLPEGYEPQGQILTCGDQAEDDLSTNIFIFLGRTVYTSKEHPDITYVGPIISSYGTPVGVYEKCLREEE